MHAPDALGEKNMEAEDKRKTRTGRAEEVAARVLPHARDELHEAAGEDGHADDDVRDGDPARVDVEHRQDERGRREGEDPAAWVGNGAFDRGVGCEAGDKVRWEE